MNKWLLLSGLLLVLAAVLVPVSISSFAPHDAPPQAAPPAVIVTKEAFASGKTYKQYAEGDALYTKNEEVGVRSFLRRLTTTPKPAMALPSAQAAASFDYLPEGGLIDPASLQQGIHASIPFTYDANLEQSAIYLATLLADGWNMWGAYRDPAYLDYYLRKQDLTARVIIVDGSLKVFGDVRMELPDPQIYTAESGS